MGMLSAIEERLGQKVLRSLPLGGGGPAVAEELIFADGSRAFLKRVSSGSPFKMEALGLNRLHCPQGVRVPQVLMCAEDYLLLEWLEAGSPTRDFQIKLGRQLAMTHRECRGIAYGFDEDHVIGATPQKNQPWTVPSPGSWAGFWWSHRLSPMLERLGDPGLGVLGRKLSDRLDRLLTVPPVPPSLLHGDLWSGNVMADAQGQPCMFDPAPYYGHPEAELAMTRMFGGFTEDFYRAYQELTPLDPDWEPRQDLYMLYHVLNHAVLFGGGYRSQAAEILRRYV